MRLSGLVHGTQRVAFATREDATVQVVRVAEGSDPTVASLDAALSGRLAVVARPEVGARPAAVFLETVRGTERVLIDEDGDLGAMVRENMAAMQRAGTDIFISYWVSRYNELLKD